MRCAVILLALLVVVACGEGEVDWARQLEKAQALLQDERHDGAYAEYVRYAEKGNGLAEFTVGLFHRHGWGRAVDEKTAVSWFARAAENGIPAAQHYYGEHLLDGTYLPADPAGAAKWLQRAAEGGHLLSLVALADLHLEGRGVARDPDRALRLLGEAAEMSVTAAQLRLGALFLDGAPGISPDPDEAARWLERAAHGGSHEAQHRLGRLLRDGGAGPQAREAARFWFERAASEGHLASYRPTAELYLEAPAGTRPEADHLAKAYLWLTAAYRRVVDAEERARIGALLAALHDDVPDAWRDDLDAKVEAHLEEIAKGGS